MIGRLKLNRYTASATHLALSVLIFLIFLSLMLFYWYPKPYFSLQGGTDVLKILVGVDLILGPLITLIIFVPGKRGLKFDIACIALVQIGALFYGGNIIYQERPIFSVFAVDRFIVMGINDIDIRKLPSGFKAISSSGPVPVYARFPEDQKERENLMFEALSTGKDIEQRPEYYTPLADHWEQAKKRSIKLELLENKNNAVVLEKFFQNRKKEDYVFFPIYGRFEQTVAAFHKETALFEESLPIPVP